MSRTPFVNYKLFLYIFLFTVHEKTLKLRILRKIPLNIQILSKPENKIIIYNFLFIINENLKIRGNPQ